MEYQETPANPKDYLPKQEDGQPVPIVWGGTVDDATFVAFVQANDEDNHRGTLVVQVVASGEELLREEVAVAYGAIFGADVDNIADWEDKSVTVIDAYNENRSNQ